ncbi:pyruvate kinase [Flexithrix dorotheae]|uniref:pyruvate kinase n=1 Tax=Flexithrix dorotheae TaxID=70993 RepID=UPI00037B18D9|nr:pyruvate kinase [Flexithrix dorotheae]
MRKKTKIVATISDKNCDVDLIRKLRNAGMNVVRLNTAHQNHDDTLKVINNVRAVSKRIALLLDTKGPEIRTTASNETIEVKFGDKVIVKGDPSGITSKECVYVNYADFVKDVPVNSRILIDDGSLELRVVEKDNEKLVCEVKNNGIIKGKKSVNIPSVHVKLPALSQKDIEFIHFAIEQKLDFIAHSFVRNKEDVIAVQKILDEKNSNIKIIAKIENHDGVENIDEILDYAYGVMVARGDLAVEIPQERIPITQKMIINKCIARRKPVITATQMLHSMIENPRPTRAEISDVANAIYDGTDAIMLSGETAYGDYPVESVETMSKIAMEIEAAKPNVKETEYLVVNNVISAFVARSAVQAAYELGAKAIIIDTQNGRTARALAAYRGKNFIYAQCYQDHVVRELALTYAVFATYMEKESHDLMFLKRSLDALIKKDRLKKEDRIVVVAGNHGDFHGASFMEISTVEMLEKHLKTRGC